jgi:hypothetical protein
VRENDYRRFEVFFFFEAFRVDFFAAFRAFFLVAIKMFLKLFSSKHRPLLTYNYVTLTLHYNIFL